MGKELQPLTDMQTAFVVAFVFNGGNATQAAKKAGYSAHSARVQAQILLAKPHVLAAIHVEQARVIGGELATLAVGVVRNILKDKTASKAVRLDAAKVALSLAGHVAPKAPEAIDNKDKPVSEMTVEELEDFIRKGREAMDRSARPMIDATPEVDQSGT